MNESDEELLRWKADALQLLAGWDAVFEMIPKRDSDLGRSKHDVVADEIVRLRAERDSAQTQCRHLSDRIIGRWSDLAAEQAEMFRLRRDHLTTLGELREAGAEVVRLRAAGDALAQAAVFWPRWSIGVATAAWEEARRER